MQIQLTLPQVEIVQIVNRFENILHSHEGHFQMTIPTHGTCYFTHENKQIALTPGEALLLNPSDRHCFHMGDDAGVIIAIARGDRFHVAPPGERDEAALRKWIEPGIVKAYFRRWMDLAFEHPNVELLAAQESETRILDDLQQLMWGGEGRRQLDTEQKRRFSPSDRHLMEAMEYLRAHYTESIKIDDAAAIALQSRFHFIRSFKAATGYSPYQYVLHLRVEEAKRLLQRTSHTVTEISFILGFSTPSQFYRVFEKSVLATPEQYRNGK
ncbi:helix-turn-helix domain-containing protein [Paenibacillus sp. MCAF20]